MPDSHFGRPEHCRDSADYRETLGSDRIAGHLQGRAYLLRNGLMSVEGKIVAQRRTQFGTRNNRRLRADGMVPGNLYGHKEAPVALKAVASDVVKLLTSGIRVLDVEIDGQPAHALLKDVQWDFLGNSIEHFDLLRVDPNERITVDVHVELRGTAPGVIGGGVLEHMLRTVQVECLAVQIPSAIYVKLGSLEIGHAVHVRELDAPPNTKILNNPDTVVVMIEKPGAEKPEGTEGPAQPELIGRKVEDKDAAAEAPKKK